jgi:ABC-2 type transport system ATP-binding protein
MSIRKLVDTLPGDDALPGRLTGREMLTWKGLMNGLTPQATAARVRRVLTVTGLVDVAETPVHSYPPGLRTRAGVAVILMSDPDPLAVEAPWVVKVA